MFEIIGKYNKANVYASTVEQEAYSQILNLLNQKFSEGSEIAIMPDTHAGKGCVIGFTQTIVDKVVPNLVGVDIGCGMLVLKVSKDFNKMDLPKLDKVIHQYIPSGMSHRDKAHRFASNVDLTDMIADINYKVLPLSIGSLGGGNHFIEVDTDEDGNYYIVIHSGSRHLGIEVCKYWQNKAIAYHKNGTNVKADLVAKLKAEGRENEIQDALNSLDIPKIPAELSYLEGEDLKGYLHDMKIAQEYAIWNREAMLDVIISEMGIKKHDILDKFCTVHNYINMDDMILRKGAISLHEDELAIIPMNMRDGSLIVKGKGNPDWNCSGPHGAGRLMSRSKAKESLAMADFKSSMEGIYTTSVCAATIDESPMAYKPMDEILENIKDNAEIVSIIKPIYNFKASE